MARIEYHKNNPLSWKWIILGLIISFLLITSPIFFFFYPFASTEKKSYFHGKNPILFKGSQQGNAIIENNTLFVPLSFLKKDIDSTIIYDEKSHSVIITTSDKVVQMPTDSLTYFFNQKPIKLELSPIALKNEEIFVAIDPILTFYPIHYKKLADRNVIWFQKDGDRYINGQLISNDVSPEKLRLRTEPSWQSPYTSEMSKKEQVMIEGEKDGFYLVRKGNGISGFIKKEYVQKHETVNIKITRQAPNAPTPKLDGPVRLTWEAVYTKNPDPSKIPAMTGVNVVSPTWFSLADNDGTIKNLASLDYSKWAKSKGFQVWGLFSNAFNPTLTHEALKDFKTRQRIIQQLLHFSHIYQLQGINFDIENVNKEDGKLVTQLMREATPYLHEAGLIVSLDITFSAGENNNWSSFYERKELAQIADYLIVMAYDEHTGPSSGSGSVASLPWVQKNLQNLLTEVPHDRLILGVPLYTRLWKEQVKADGTKEVSSTSFTMDQVKSWMKEKQLKPTYDEKSGQNYAEFYDTNENATYKIWIEDELSLHKRVNLAMINHLAGVASWSRIFGDQTAWSALDMNTDTTVTKK